jgi:acetyl-CoA C-acetyltransferase
VREVVIADAVRTPFGRRWGSLAGMHSVDLLGHVQQAVIAQRETA